MGVGPQSSSSPGAGAGTGTGAGTGASGTGSSSSGAANGGDGSSGANSTVADDDAVTAATAYRQFADDPSSTSTFGTNMNSSASAASDRRATQQYPGYPTLLHLLGRNTLRWMGSLNSDSMFRGMYER